MSDIVERLRNPAMMFFAEGEAGTAKAWLYEALVRADMAEGAAEIERLRAALLEIAELGSVRRDEVRSIARRALEVTKP